MRVLIVDDDESKAALLRLALEDCGVPHGDVEIADDVVAARRKLRESHFDILLLDVLLPVRKPGKASGENSVELLREIFDDESLNAPRHIVGVTAAVEAMAEYAADFRRMTLSVVQVCPGDDTWRDFISHLVLFVSRVKESQGAFDVDVCVLNALKEPELDALVDVWPFTSLSAEKLLDHSVLYREGVCEMHGTRYRAVCGYPAQMGIVSAAHAATALIATFRPRVLVMTGICGGFADHVSIGDVVVAEKSWDWQAGKWTEAGTLSAAPDQRYASAELLARARTIEPELLDAMSQKFCVGRGDRVKSRIHIGPMVSGSSVVASMDIQKVFRGQHRKMVAVDMECYALYYAVAVASSPATKVLCVKAVSDLADRQKGDDFQLYCSQISAAVGLEIVQRYFESARLRA